MRRGFVDTPDGQLHYWEHGSRDAPPLVLLHLTPDARTYLEAMLYLGDGSGDGPGLRAIAVDTPGYGDSARPPQPYETIAQFADAVARVPAALGIERYHLLGHMTGANVAAELAARHPATIERLVLSELVDWRAHAEHQGSHARRFPAPEPAADGSHLLALWNQYAPMLVEEAGEVTLDDAQRRFLALWLATYAGPPFGALDDSATAHYGEAGWPAAAPHTIEAQPLAERLAAIAAPTLVLCAGEGVLRTGADPRADRDRLTGLLPQGEALTVPGVSHVWAHTRPVAFADAVARFLSVGAA
jgi:pimeloyl-ACP methyl ester carboxylesterase